MKKMKLLCVLSAGLLFASCAPAVTGSQSFNPVVASSGTAPLQGQAGQTVYVQYTYPRSVFTIPDERYASLYIGTSNGVSSSESHASWLSMTPTGLPEGWRISLADAALRKEVVSSALEGDMVRYRYYERVRVVYRVTLPAGASGRELGVLTFKDGNTTIGSVPLVITVGDTGPVVGAHL